MTPRRNRRIQKNSSRGSAPSTSWDRVAQWYDRLVGEDGSDYHLNVIIPSAERLLSPQAGERFLDLCCGQGVFARRLVERSAAHVLAIDASPRLIEAARKRSAAPSIRYVVRDARELGDLADGSFDGAACIMALQDLEEIERPLRGLCAALRPGGRAVFVLMHPCFRIPRQSGWGWDDQKKTQFRRIDRYASPMIIPIATHPVRDPAHQTFFFHRPLAEILNTIAAAGLSLVQCEELLTHRRSDPGGRSRGENRSAAEIPIFLALLCIRPGQTLTPSDAVPQSAGVDSQGSTDRP